jgi:hypothetical protein
MARTSRRQIRIHQRCHDGPVAGRSESVAVQSADLQDAPEAHDPDQREQEQRLVIGSGRRRPEFPAV